MKKLLLIFFLAIILIAVMALVVILSGPKARADEFVDGRWIKTTPVVVLHDWESLDQLKDFLSKDDTDWVNYPDKDGTVWFTASETQDCDDYAYRLQTRGEDIGRRLTTESLTSYEMMQYRDYLPIDAEIKPNSAHLLNKARIGNEVYYVEPQNDNVWLGFYIDNIPAPVIQPSKPKLEPEQEGF